MKISSLTPVTRPFAVFLLASAAGLPVIAQNAPAPAAVQVTSPQRGDIHRFVTLPGTLRANQQVTLHAKVAGYLKSIAVDKGDTVKAGQLLAEIEMPELVAERAKFDAELRIAKLESERLVAARAKAPDLITPAATDTAESRLALAQAGLAHYETLLRYSKISAPFDGVVTMRYVDPGAFVPAATASSNPTAAAIVTVMDYSTIRVRVPVPEIESARIQVGQPVIVTTDSLPGRMVRGTVTRSSGALDEATRSLLVEADVPNADGTLRPGMYVLARIGVEKHTGALLVPAAALVREKAAGFLFTLVDGKAVRGPVKYGFNDGTNVEILDGLAESARVIIPGKAALVSGQAVTATEVK
ncbi:efflux RND transporter periplasmic adaptor subunit [Horticoccus sp. 23ND18S-11]|uniref:efflux RND transporter periplasmic adaptor subunit n=1 Tax=Horticoccus sp. 23ND18S-11 TaxID=3391832 RepID=UPI0039C8F02D